MGCGINRLACSPPAIEQRLVTAIAMTPRRRHVESSEVSGKMSRDASDTIPLRQNVRQAIRQYLEDMGSCQAESLYQILLSQVEPPLIEEVLRFTRGNQSQTARILGITRNTLRAKLSRYDILVTNGKAL